MKVALLLTVLVLTCFASADRRPPGEYTEQQSEDLMSRFLWIGQGQRYLDQEDIESFKDAAIKLNFENPENATLFTLGWLQESDHLPEDNLSIVKLAILYTLNKKNKLSDRLQRTSYSEHFNNYSYNLGRDYTVFGKPYDIWILLEEVTLTNYPVLLSMLEQRIGIISKHYPPELRITPRMINIMRKSKNLNSAEIELVVKQIEDGEHISSTVPEKYISSEPFYAPIGGETWVRVNWPLASCSSLLSK